MRNRNEFVQLIDRYRLGQAQRLSIGSKLSDDFSTLQSTLLLAEGRGKFLRVRWIEGRRVEIPQAVALACRQAAHDPQFPMREFAQLRVDLTRAMATGVNQLAAVSGVHANMLMVVCIDEPGIGIRDYDGSLAWQPFCEPETLAEITGLTIVDSLPSRDLAAGGRGGPFTPLPAWLLFADRNSKIAEQPRLLVDLGAWTELTWLPESDGLDDDLPAIRFERLLGTDFEAELMSLLESECSIAESIAGQDAAEPHQGLMDLWCQFEGQNDLNRELASAEKVTDLVQRALSIVTAEQLSPSTVLGSFAAYLVEAAVRFVRKRGSTDKMHLVPGGKLVANSRLGQSLNQAFEAPWFDGQTMNYDAPHLRATTAAICGLMHVDQMPITIPWISGSEMPRVLGRLTPGSPAHWRRVIMDMGDCRPPVMKLREAV